jgi:hypothetical protein
MASFITGNAAAKKFLVLFFGLLLENKSCQVSCAENRPRRIPLVLRGGFKNMYGEAQCTNFSRGEAGTSQTQRF